MTALHWAVDRGRSRDRERLDPGGRQRERPQRRGLTPLMLAAGPPTEPVLRLLLKAGADPNLANAVGTTPLMRAAAAGDVATVTALLDRGATSMHKKPRVTTRR